jgi:adhesin HecA-like repeat protein
MAKAKRRFKSKTNEIVKFATLDECEIRYKLSKAVIAELANSAGALFRINGGVRIDVEKLDNRLMDFCDNRNPDSTVWESDILILAFLKTERSDLYKNVHNAYLEMNKHQMGEAKND